MIPYIELTTFHIGPIPMQVWGLLVAAGILVGLLVSARRAKRLGLDKKHVYEAASWIIIAALLGGRLVYSFIYDISTTIQDPLNVIRVWDGGASIIGGFLGALIAAIWYFRKHGLDVWAYSDATIFGLPIGLFIGRIGCFLIHDHPGTLTDFVLGVQYPDGAVRHDHGLYLAINGLVLAIIFAVMSRFKMPKGMYMAVFAAWYGCVRFWLDFTRVIDTTYLGLTPAQYASIGLFVAGLAGIYIFLRRARRHDNIDQPKK